MSSNTQIPPQSSEEFNAQVASDVEMTDTAIADIETVVYSKPTIAVSSASNLQNSASALITLPQEIHLVIFSNLDECTSACLGLTCRAMYTIHHEKFPITNPNTEWEIRSATGVRVRGGQLFTLLGGFMGWKWVSDRLEVENQQMKVRSERLMRTIDMLMEELRGMLGPGLRLGFPNPPPPPPLPPRPFLAHPGVGGRQGSG